MRFWALRNEWAIPGCSGLSPHCFILSDKSEEQGVLELMPKKNFQFRNKDIKDNVWMLLP